jgi:divalent metal cation (Fe/Co/Zn/Cd) transporter
VTLADRAVLVRRGIGLERLTLGWNVVGVVVLAVAAARSRSVAVAGFGLDSLIEIGASTVVLWELGTWRLDGSEHGRTTDADRQRRALRLIGAAFAALAAYLLVTSGVVLVLGARGGAHPGSSPLGIAWTAVTALVMLALAWGKARTGRALGNPVLLAEGRVTLVDGLLATAVLCGLVLRATLGWWWADPLAGLVLVGYAVIEARSSRASSRPITTA